MKKHNERVAARIARVLKKMPAVEAVEGVMPLNPGFFTLERIRDTARPKKRDVIRAKINGREK